jgi:hypothetical protein
MNLRVQLRKTKALSTVSVDERLYISKNRTMMINARLNVLNLLIFYFNSQNG